MKTASQTALHLSLLVIAFMLLSPSAHAASTMPFTDHFAYASSGNLGSVGGTGNWNGSSTAATMTSGNLDGTGLGLPPSSGNMVAMSGSTGGTYNLFATASGDIISGIVYCSFLVKVNDASSASTTGERVISMNIQNGSSTRYVELFFQNVAGAVQLGLAKNGSTPIYVASGPGSSVADGNTYFVVISQEFVGGLGNDVVKLWVNPASLGGAEDGSPNVLINTGADITSATGIGRLYFIGGVVLNVDEFRLGTTWADVAPTTGPVIGTKLGFTTQPANAAPGATMAPVIVQIQTPGGASVSSNGVPVTLTLTSGSGTLGGTVTQLTDSTGKATFNDLSIDTAGIGKQLTASASGIGAGLSNAVSNPFNIAEQPVGGVLAFSQQPVDAVVNATLNGIIVQIQDTNGAAIASNAVPITLNLTSGSGTLNGTVTRNTDGTGKAVFNDLSIDTDGTGKQLTATASGIGTGLTDAISNPFNITLTPVGVKLTFTTQPSTTPANTSISDIVVQIQDNSSAAVSSNNVPITLTLTLGSGTLSGTTTHNTDSSGKATFSGLSIDIPGPAKQLTASASGIGSGLSSAPSSIFAITGTPILTAPVITQAVKTVSSVILRGTNGTPGGEFRVLNSSNLAQPAAQWTSILTNTFNGTGAFDCTNSVPPTPNLGFFRLLSIAGSGSILADFGLYGFATRDSDGNAYNLTGGTNGSFPQDNIVTVSNYGQLGTAISNTEPMIIQVVGEIYMRTNGNFYVRANKTIVGLGTNATLVGCLGLYGQAPEGAPWGCSNIIIRNITLRNPDQFGEDDGIAIKYGAHHIWVDHCTFHDIYDGTLDITRESDFVTVSWCKFYYNSVNSHGDTVNLIGGDDGDVSDTGKLHVTFHHNWWGPLCRERMPSVRFGRVHVYNNYFNSAGNHYCTRTRLYAEVLVENNYFDNVFNPWELATSDQGPNGKLRALGNITNNCTFSTSHYNANLPNNGDVILIPGTDTLSSGVNQLNPAPYTYPMDGALFVPTLVQTHAGAGNGPFAP